MTDEELVRRLREQAEWEDRDGVMQDFYQADVMKEAADRIEALTAERDKAWKVAHDVTDRGMRVEADLAAAAEALEAMHHAVCGETGFAACVRLDSGKAYPWPALDDADEAATAALARIKEKRT